MDDASGLIALRTLPLPPIEEIRYASAYNFARQRLYPAAVAFLHTDAAEALQRVQRALASEGLGLKVFDGYRPLSVQRRLWQLVQDERYVANPARNAGRHTRGTAVDLTLVDASGNELAMPTPYDEFSPRAHIASTEGTDEQRRNAWRLGAAMSEQGFVPFDFEWWHFDLRGWEAYPALDLSFEALLAI